MVKIWQVIVLYNSLISFILFVLFFAQVIPFTFEVIILAEVVPVLIGTFIYFALKHFKTEYKPKELKRRWTDKELIDMTKEKMLNQKKNPFCYDLVGSPKLVDGISRFEITPGAGILFGRLFYWTRAIIGQERFIYYFDDNGYFETLPLDGDYIFERDFWKSPIEYLKQTITMEKIKEEEKGKGEIAS